MSGKKITLPTPIKLKKEHVDALRKLENDQRAINQFMENIIETGKRKLSDYRMYHEQIWQEISKTYGIDAKNIYWDVDSPKGEIIPRQMVFTKNTE